ncbi:MAG: group 1 truncated hemoglobin, partial [Acidobacteriota bacterium]
GGHRARLVSWSSVPVTSLYEQVGGEAVLRPAISLFYRKVFQDASLLPFFEGVDRERLEAHQLAFITQALSGPDSYDGRMLRDVHSSYSIEQRHFDVLTLHMEVAFLEMGLDQELVNQALATIRELARDIVNTK